MNRPPSALAASPGISRTCEAAARMEALIRKHAPRFIGRGAGVDPRDLPNIKAIVSEAKRREIIRLRAKGYANREIAKACECDLSTVVNVLCGFSRPD